MRVDLIKSVIDSLQCPPGKRDILVFDAKLACFALRVGESGSKIFLVQYSRGGRTKRITIGRFGLITAAEARRKALALIGEIQTGIDPAAVREKVRADVAANEAERERAEAARRAADAFTVSALLDAWQSLKLKNKSASYRREGPRAVRRLLGDLSEAPAASLTTSSLQAIVDREIERAPAQTIDARACGRAAWNWAIKRNLVVANPFADVVIEHRVKSRDRVLTNAELSDAWRGASAKPYPFGPVIRLLILTLQRRSEVSGMRWSELSSDLSTWTIPAARAKNGRAHVVHLAEPAREILESLRHRRDEIRRETVAADLHVPTLFDDLIFTTTGRSPVSGIQKARRSLSPANADLPGPDCGAGERRSPEQPLNPGNRQRKLIPRAAPNDWRLHDFRRTGVSKLAELAIPPHVADRILNHVTGAIQGVAAVYQRFEFLPERKRALEVWAAHVLAIAAGKDVDSNVVKMEKTDRVAG